MVASVSADGAPISVSRTGEDIELTVTGGTTAQEISDGLRRIAAGAHLVGDVSLRFTLAGSGFYPTDPV